jgi:hypothetical protein
MRYALMGFTVVLAAIGGLQAQAGTFSSSPSVSQPTAERASRPLNSQQASVRRNAQVLEAWGDAPFGYGVQKALVEDRIVFGNPRPEAKPLASTLEDFRQDIALSDQERERYSIISTAP